MSCCEGNDCFSVQTFKFVHLSAGDLLRAERKRAGSEYGELIENHITNGTIVPVEITCKLLENVSRNILFRTAFIVTLAQAMYATGGTSCPGFLIDGFPRNRDNLEGWKRNMDDKADVAFVLFIQCDIDVRFGESFMTHLHLRVQVCVQRCLSRGATSGRSDDNEASMRKRVETYYNQTMPIIDQYAERCLVRTVDGGKGDIDEVCY